MVLHDFGGLFVVDQFENCLFRKTILACLFAERLLVLIWLVFVHLGTDVIASVLIQRGRSCVVNLESFYGTMRPEVILSYWRIACFCRTSGFLRRNHFFKILVSCTHYNKRWVMALILLSRHLRNLFILKQSALVVHRCKFLASIWGNLWLMLGHSVFLAFIVFLNRIQPTFWWPFNDIITFPGVFISRS